MRRSEPWQPELENVLRRMLSTLADSVEPGADGLERIRAQIRSGRPVPAGWVTAGPAAAAAGGRPGLRYLQQVRRAARACVHAVTLRFAPSEEQTAWHRVLRPAAALATTVFVALAGSWVIADMPSIIAPSGRNAPTGSGAGQLPGRSTHAASRRDGSQGPGGAPRSASSQAGRRSHTATRSAGPPSASPSGPPTSQPSPSPTSLLSSPPSASPSPSASSSPSASPSPSPSCPASPSPSPTVRGRHSGPQPCRKRHHHRGPAP